MASAPLGQCSINAWCHKYNIDFQQTFRPLLPSSFSHFYGVAEGRVRKQGPLNPCCFSVGSASAELAQQQTNIGASLATVYRGEWNYDCITAPVVCGMLTGIQIKSSVFPGIKTAPTESLEV